MTLFWQGKLFQDNLKLYGNLNVLPFMQKSTIVLVPGAALVIGFFGFIFEFYLFICGLFHLFISIAFRMSKASAICLVLHNLILILN